MLAQPQHIKMSVEEYLVLDRESQDGRYEYIDGYAYLMAGGTRYHSIICVNITRELSLLLRGGRCQVFNSDAKVCISPGRYLYPDVTISCDERDLGEGEMVHHPRLIVEVLFTSTEAYDRGHKFDYYRTLPSLQEYVLVSTNRQAVTIYRRAAGDLWTLHFFGSDEQVELVSIRRVLPMTSIYEDIAKSIT